MMKLKYLPDGMAIRLLVPFPYSFECRLRKEENK